MAQFFLDLQPQRRIWTVTELTSFIRELLEGQLRDLWVTGEISNFREAQSGHFYFTLKDDRAQIRCVCFRNEARRLPFRPEDGLRVIVHGSVSVYDARGEYQLYVGHIEPVGLGALQLAIEQLKKRPKACSTRPAKGHCRCFRGALAWSPPRWALLCETFFACCGDAFLACTS